MLAAATDDPRPVPEVMADFTSYGLAQGPDEIDRLFHGAGLCLTSLACGVTGGDPATFSVHDLPSEWFGEVEHTHRAIDDARGYGNLLVEVLRRPGFLRG